MRSDTRTLTLPRPQPWIPGESIAGLLVRNATEHGFGNPARMLAPLGLDREPLATIGMRTFNDGEAQAFAELLGIGQAVFDRMHHGAAAPNKKNLFGHLVHDEMVTHRHRRVCPLCLAESAHHRAIWNMSMVTVCPIHGALLIGRCPKAGCGRRLSWSTPAVHTCSDPRCMASVAEAPVTIADAGKLGGLRSLIEMIAGDEVAGAPEMPAGDVCRMSFLLGLLATGHARVGRPISYAIRHPEAMPAVIDAGWQAFRDWPRGFHAYLGELRRNVGIGKGRWGLHKEFGTLRNRLMGFRDEALGRQLLVEFETYVAAQGDFATPWRKRSRKTPAAAGPEPVRVITARDAMDVLQVSYVRLVELASRHDLWITRPTGKGAPSLVHPERFDALAKLFRESLHYDDVAVMLNVQRRSLRRIRAMGLLPEVPENERLVPERAYRKADIEAFLARLEAMAVPGATVCGRGQLVTLETLGHTQMSIADVLAAVVSGQIRPEAIDEAAVGLPRLLFRQETARAAVKGTLATMSVLDAARALGVKEQVAYAWTRAGLLPVVESDARFETGRRVTAEGLEAFRATYIKGTDAATAYGLRARWMSVHLVQLGVRPVSGPDVDGCRQFLFRRTDVDAIAPSRLISGMAKLLPRPEQPSTASAWQKMHVALERNFGRKLHSRFQTLSDAADGLVVHCLTARNSGVLGTYHFVLAGGTAEMLDAADRAYLAVGFADRDDYQLVAWKKARAVLEMVGRVNVGERGGWRFDVRVEPDGRMEPFADSPRKTV